jgi:hypothetical protein
MILKKSPLFYILYFLLIFLITKSIAQKTPIAEPEFSSQPLCLLILPGTTSEFADQSLQNEITDLVADIAWETGRFDVFDRIDVDHLLEKSHLDKAGTFSDSVIMALGDSVQCDEVLMVDLKEFSQVGVPPREEEEEDRNFFETIIEGLFGTDSKDYSDNIHTRLSVQFRNIDLITGNEIDQFLINVSYTGGDKSESEEKALQKYSEVVFNEVCLMYQLVSEVIAVDRADLDLSLGRNLGVTGNTVFEIISPYRVENSGDEEIVYPGEPAGLACVQSIGDTISRSRLIRQWGVIEPGFYAYEFNKHIHGMQIFIGSVFPGDYLAIGGQYHYSPLADWDIGGGLHYVYLTDSYDEKNHGFGFGVFGSRKLLNLPAVTLKANLGFDLDLPFKRDDDGRMVTTAVFSSALGISCNLMLKKNSDIEILFAYHLSLKSSSWTYSEDDETYDAFWTDTPPLVDLSGIYLSVGYKFVLF